MFKKIHSKRDPGDTLWREIKKEFGVYFDRADTSANDFLARYPKPVFTAMTLLMLISLILSFTVLRNHGASDQPPPVSTTGHLNPVSTPTPSLRPVTNGLNQILEATSAIKETLALKKEIENLLTKDHLNSGDSLALAKALDRLGQINHQINPAP